jgi:hypothetical protein
MEDRAEQERAKSFNEGFAGLLEGIGKGSTVPATMAGASRLAAEQGLSQNDRYNAGTQLLNTFNQTILPDTLTGAIGRVSEQFQKTAGGKKVNVTKSTAPAPRVGRSGGGSKPGIVEGERLTDFDRAEKMVEATQKQLAEVNRKGAITPDEIRAKWDLVKELKERQGYVEKTFPKATRRKKGAVPEKGANPNHSSYQGKGGGKASKFNRIQ